MPQIRAHVGEYTRAEIIAKLEGTGLPFAPIGRPEEMLDDPHLAASDGLEPVVLDNGTETRLPTLPLTMNGSRPASKSRLPAVGEDTLACLKELGYSDVQIDALVASGVAGISE